MGQMTASGTALHSSGSTPFHKTLRRGVIALSLANILHLQIWTQYLGYRKADRFLMDLPPSPGQYMGLVVTVIGEALLLFLVATMMRAVRGRIAAAGRIAFFILLLIPLENSRQILLQICRAFRRHAFRIVAPNLFVILIAVAVAALLIYNKRYSESRLIHALSAILLITSPLVLFTFSQAVAKSMHYDERP
jgi:hypothetical protein